MTSDRYGSDVLASGRPEPPRGRATPAEATLGLVVEEVMSDFCGEVVAVDRDLGTLTLEDRRGRRRGFPLGPGFLLEGRPVVFSVGHDVTAAVLAERSLAAAESKYRALVERMPDVVWTTDQDGRITFITANVTSVCGFTDDELRAGGIELWFERVHDDDRAVARAAFDAMFAGGKPTTIEYRWQHRDGRWLWLRERMIAAYPQDGVTCVDGMLILLEESTGTVALIEANPKGWVEHGRFTLTPQTDIRSPKGKIWTHPVVSNGKLYLRDQDLIFCFDVSSNASAKAE